MQLFGTVSEPVLRLSVFAGVFLAMALLELALPKRDLTAPKTKRWLTNLAIVGLDSLLVRAMDLAPRLLGSVLIPLAAVATAIWAEGRGIGLFNWLALPAWFEVLAAIIIFDFAIWLQHVASHRIPAIWNFHQVHHADVDIDVTTAIRFHPVEIGLSMLYKMAWVVVLGPAPIAILLFEVILNAGALFSHANVALPAGLDRALRRVIVTPDMHRVHHSVVRREHSSNFGFNLSVWDRLFGTYIDQPAAGHRSMTIGLPEYQNSAPTTLAWSLAVPFRKPKINPE
jgi:sterol desaturase/sphingolipid hydroxylase (fatty acid hydroxylase superfamily)